MSRRSATMAALPFPPADPLPVRSGPRGRPAWPGAVSTRRAFCLLPLALTAATPAQRLVTAPSAWAIEAADPRATVRWTVGTVEIDTRAGLTLWYRERLHGPVAIEFDAMAVSAGGANDRVSDLNAFWMATDPAVPGGSPVGRRDGVFERYDTLRTYYVGIGGNRNTSTRMRRYVGRAGERPLRPEHDRADRPALLRPNVWTRVRLVADGSRIAVWRDGRRLFALDDPAPYRAGWFGLRTTWSHLKVRGLRVTRP